MKPIRGRTHGFAALRTVPCPSRRQGTGRPAPRRQGWPPRRHLAVAALTAGVDRRCEYGPVANSFRVDETPGAAVLGLSNGGTDVLFDVLTLAGCHLARTTWEQHLILMFATCHRSDRGTSGFDLIELPWTPDWPPEKAFLLAVLDLAAGRYRWDELGYDPPHAHDYVTQYRDMVAGFTPHPALSCEGPDGVDWSAPPDPEDLQPCERHGLYVGYYTGCRLEDD